MIWFVIFVIKEGVLNNEMNEKYEKAKELVKKYHQEHLLKFYDDLDDEKKK